MAVEGQIIPNVLPAGSKQEKWNWLFKGRIPGIIQLFGALGEVCKKPKKAKIGEGCFVLGGYVQGLRGLGFRVRV